MSCVACRGVDGVFGPPVPHIVYYNPIAARRIEPDGGSVYHDDGHPPAPVGWADKAVDGRDAFPAVCVTRIWRAVNQLAKRRLFNLFAVSTVDHAQKKEPPVLPPRQPDARDDLKIGEQRVGSRGTV